MKKITFLTFLFFTTLGFSQIKKIKTEKTQKIGKSANVTCEKTGNTYIFTYRDINFSQLEEYKSFAFEDVQNAFEELYKIIIKGFEEVPKEPIELKLPNQIITLKYMKSFGVVNLTILSDENGIIGRSEYLTKRRINKLFGKKK